MHVPAKWVEPQHIGELMSYHLMILRCLHNLHGCYSFKPA